MDFAEFTGISRARSPSASLSALVSQVSFCRVELPCELTWSIAPGATPDTSMAWRMARVRSSPSDSRSVMWMALDVCEKPLISR